MSDGEAPFTRERREWRGGLASIARAQAGHSEVRGQVAAGTPVRIAAPAVLEIAYGYQRFVARDARYGELLAGDAFAVVALDWSSPALVDT